MFSTFKFACHGYLQEKLIVHIQCLLGVDGSLVAGVFLTSFFCVVPESPYSSNVASSSLLVAWYSNCFSAGSLSTSGFRNWWLFSSIDLYAVVSDQFRSQLLTAKLLLCLTTHYYVLNRIVVHMK